MVGNLGREEELFCEWLDNNVFTRHVCLPARADDILDHVILEKDDH